LTVRTIIEFVVAGIVNQKFGHLIIVIVAVGAGRKKIYFKIGQARIRLLLC